MDVRRTTKQNRVRIFYYKTSVYCTNSHFTGEKSILKFPHREYFHVNWFGRFQRITWVHRGHKHLKRNWHVSTHKFSSFDSEIEDGIIPRRNKNLKTCYCINVPEGEARWFLNEEKLLVTNFGIRSLKKSCCLGIKVMFFLYLRSQLPQWTGYDTLQL